MKINEKIYVLHLAHHKLSIKYELLSLFLFLLTIRALLKKDGATLRDNEFLKIETRIC